MASTGSSRSRSASSAFSTWRRPRGQASTAPTPSISPNAPPPGSMIIALGKLGRSGSSGRGNDAGFHVLARLLLFELAQLGE